MRKGGHQTQDSVGRENCQHCSTCRRLQNGCPITYLHVPPPLDLQPCFTKRRDTRGHVASTIQTLGVGKTQCEASPAPAWEGRQGAEAAIVSAGSTVALSRTRGPFPQRTASVTATAPDVVCRGGASQCKGRCSSGGLVPQIRRAASRRRPCPETRRGESAPSPPRDA